MYPVRFTKSVPACLLALLLAGSLASAASAGARPLAPIAHRDTSLFAPLAPARASSTLTSVNEYGRLQKQNSSGANIDEQGVGWGSFNCSVLMELTLSGTLVTAKYTAYLSGGSISGTATAHIHSATKTAAQFSGTITLQHGTHGRSGASGTADFSGEINRTSYAMSTHMTGKLRL
jgi:hypothetical protein